MIFLEFWANNMRYIIFINSKNVEFKQTVTNLGIDWNVRKNDDVIELYYKGQENHYVILECSAHIEQDYDEDEMLFINEIFEVPRFCYLKYSDLETLRIALGDLVNSGKCIIDNDHGELLPGEEFVIKWKSNPKWNWNLVE